MRKLATVLLTGALFFATVSPAAGQTQARNSCPSGIPRAGYADVDLGSPHAFDIDCILWRGITDRQGVFGPTENLPRWEMASWIFEALAWVQWVTVQNPTTFADTAALPGDTQSEIEFVRMIGITKGTGPGTYDPYGAVPRWQMALFLTRMVAAAGVSLPDGAGQGFDDILGTTGEAQLAINQLAQLGITFGTSPTTFSPDDTVTREQMASFVGRTLEQIWVLSPTFNCEDPSDVTCATDRVEPIPANPLRLRATEIGIAGEFSVAEWRVFFEDPAVTMEIYVDGARQIATKSVLERDELVYGFWETSLPAGISGTHEIRTLFIIDGQVVAERVLTITFF